MPQNTQLVELIPKRGIWSLDLASYEARRPADNDLRRGNVLVAKSRPQTQSCNPLTSGPVISQGRTTVAGIRDGLIAADPQGVQACQADAAPSTIKQLAALRTTEV